MASYRVTCYRETFEEGLSLDEAILAVEKHVRGCPSGPMPHALNIRWYRIVDGSYVSASDAYGWLDHTVRPEGR